MKIFTIGFTKKTAERFFGLLARPDILRVVDIRLNNNSQLASFTRREDLRYFLKSILGKDYVHLPELAPSAEMLKTYRDGQSDWIAYERHFTALMRERRVEQTIAADLVDGGCLLCSEATPEHCHRRLVAEYFQTVWPEAIVEHLI